MSAFVTIMPDRSLRMTMAGEERIRASRDAGGTIKALAAEFAVSAPTMRRWAEELGCAGALRNLSTADWNEHRIARFRELWDEGLATAEIAKRLHTTKNAICGKAHRLGFPPRQSPIKPSTDKPKSPRQPRRAPRFTLAHLPSLRAVPMAFQTKQIRPPSRPVEAAAPIVPVVSALPCCWPIGEPKSKDFRYCDAPSLSGKPYCQEHNEIAYIRPRDRRGDVAY